MKHIGCDADADSQIEGLPCYLVQLGAADEQSCHAGLHAEPRQACHFSNGLFGRLRCLTPRPQRINFPGETSVALSTLKRYSYVAAQDEAQRCIRASCGVRDTGLT